MDIKTNINKLPRSLYIDSPSVPEPVVCNWSLANRWTQYRARRPGAGDLMKPSSGNVLVCDGKFERSKLRNHIYLQVMTENNLQRDKKQQHTLFCQIKLCFCCLQKMISVLWKGDCFKWLNSSNLQMFILNGCLCSKKYLWFKLRFISSLSCSTFYTWALLFNRQRWRFHFCSNFTNEVTEDPGDFHETSIGWTCLTFYFFKILFPDGLLVFYFCELLNDLCSLVH